MDRKEGLIAVAGVLAILGVLAVAIWKFDTLEKAMMSNAPSYKFSTTVRASGPRGERSKVIEASYPIPRSAESKEQKQVFLAACSQEFDEMVQEDQQRISEAVR